MLKKTSIILFIIVLTANTTNYCTALEVETVTTSPVSRGFRSAKVEVPAKSLDLPKIETSRLTLRKLEVKDAQDMFEFTCDPAVETCDPIDTCLDDTKQYIQQTIENYKHGKAAPWAIELKQEKKLIGYCGFFEFDPKNSKCRIAFALSPKYQNQGLMSEALAAIVDFTFNMLKINRIEARVHLDDDVSPNLLNKLGMTCEGTLSEFEHIKGGFQDVKIFSLLRQNYLKK